jgi:hypothetical protein
LPSFAEVENKARLIVLERPPNYHYVVLSVSADEVGGRGCTLWTLSVRDFPALICHPRRRKCIHLQTEGGGGVAQDLRKTQKLPQKVSDGKRSQSIISSMYIISQCLAPHKSSSFKDLERWDFLWLLWPNLAR